MARGKQDDNSPAGNAARASIARQQAEHRRFNRGNVDPADWREADPNKVAALIHNITRHGFAVRFGYTRDGGAFAVGIVGDGEPTTHFIRPNESIDLFLDSASEAYANLITDTPPFHDA